MIIGVDGTCLQGPPTEIGGYLPHLLEAVSHLLEEDKIYVWMNNPTPEERARVPENRFIAVSATHYPWAALKMTWNTLGTPTMESLLGRPPDVCFYPNFLILPQKHGKKVLFVPDLIFLTNPNWASEELGKSPGGKFEKQIKEADLILTCSEYNRQEILKQFQGTQESQIRVIPYGLPESFRKPASPEQVKALRERHLLNHPYFLFVGTLEPRKNLLRLIHAFLLFKQKVTTVCELILAGPKGRVGNEFMDFIQSPVLKGKVRWLSDVPMEELPAFYTGAEAFVFPSLSEGFGMPVLEAMGCGTAVLCSTGAAIPEVAGDGAWLVEPTSLNDWARAFERVLTEPAFKEVLREKGRARSTHFRIDHIAQQTLNALKSIVPGHA